MSGFAGIAGPISDTERQWLDQAARFMAFRGPDIQATWHLSHVGMAGALLATDPSRDAVLASLDGAFWIVGDVRLDRRDELRSRLGESPATLLSDLDLVLRAYWRWGKGCLERLSGDFAFILWDEREHCLLGARDCPGIAPFYYARAGRHWLFSNTFETFFLHPAVSEDINEIAIGDFLIHGFNQSHETMVFSQIQRLPPGFMIACSGDGAQTRQFRHLERNPALLRLPFPSDYPEAFREHLTQAVRDRMPAGPFGIHLSGGMDSTSVAATATGLLGKPEARTRMRAFTVELDGVIDNREGEYAQQVSEWLGLEREVLQAVSSPLRDPLIPDSLGPAPVPYLPTRVQLDLLAQTAATGRVGLTGHGGDLALGFHSSYWMEWVMSGKWLRFGIVIAEHLRLFGSPPRLFPRAAWADFRNRDTDSIPPWIAESFIRRTHLRERNTAQSPRWRQAFDSTGFAGSAFWSTVMEWHDPGFSRLPLRFRHPFFDLELLEFAAALPPMPWTHGKSILRQAMRGLLPESVRTRRKEVLRRQESKNPVGPHPALPEILKGAAERFLDFARVTAASEEPNRSLERERELMNAIGLAYWLFHWRRPRPAQHFEPFALRHPEFGAGT